MLLLFVAAAALTAGCVVVREKEEVDKTIPREAPLPVDVFEDGNIFDAGREPEGSRQFAESAYQALLRLGIPNAQIDTGYYFFGEPAQSHFFELDEKPIGANDGRIHEFEIYHAVRVLGGAKIPAIMDLADKLEFRAGDFQEAILRKEGKKDGDFDDPKNDLSKIHVYQRILHLKPKTLDHGILFYLGSTLARSGDFKNAIVAHDAYESGLAKLGEPLSDEDRVNLSKAAENLFSWSAALVEQTAQSVGRRSLASNDANHFFLFTDEDKKEIKQALMHSISHMEVKESYPASLRLNAGILLYAVGETDHAIGFFQDTLRPGKGGKKTFSSELSKKEKGMAHLFLGKALLKQNKPVQANLHLQKAEDILGAEGDPETKAFASKLHRELK